MRLAPHPITLRQLQYIVAVADRKSFRKAAEDCHVSQPALSAQLALAEESLGARLFERDRRRVILTPAGEDLVERAREILTAADALVEAAQRHADPLSGTLRIGVIPTIGPYLLPEVAADLRREYPKITFVWREDKTAALLSMLDRAELDGAVVALEADVGDRPRVVLGKDPFVLAAPPEHALSRSKRPLRPEELSGEPVLLLDDGHCFRDQALTVCSRAGAVESGFRATSLTTLVQMAAGGAGVTLLPSLAVPVENRHRDLHLRPFAPKVPARTLALVWRPRSAMEVALRAVGERMRAGYVALEKRAPASG